MSLEISIPGGRDLHLEGVVFDMNGTLTRDGRLIPGVAAALQELAASLKLYVMTADTFGTAQSVFAALPVELVGIPAGKPGAAAKQHFICSLGADSHAAVGNGRNDRLLLAAAGLGICVIGPEGAHREALAACDLVVTDPVAALELLLNPRRLTAGLRP